MSRRKLDLNDPGHLYSMAVRTRMVMLYELFVSDRSMSLRRSEKNSDISRRSIGRYLLTYSKQLDYSWPDFDETGKQIEWDDVRQQVIVRIREMKERYQRKRG